MKGWYDRNKISQVLGFTLPGNGSLLGGHQNVTLTAKDARVIYHLSSGAHYVGIGWK